jgi:hypothetical protein
MNHPKSRGPALATLATLATLCSLAALPACSSDEGASAAGTTDAGPTDTETVTATDTGTATDTDTDTDTVTTLGSCSYTNPFSQGAECKAYTGDGWTESSAEEDCGAVLLGNAGTFELGGTCAFDAELGRCTVDDAEAGLGYLLVSAGDNEGDCALAKTGCETFGGGTFAPSGVCLDGSSTGGGSTGGGGGGGDVPVYGQTPFIQPELVCKAPLEGEPAGQSEGGEVCTWQLISGCTEPGRRFDDYASCDVVYAQRPYYAYPGEPVPTEDDPRLDDEAYLGELAWAREQVEACACVCCHSDRAPNGPSGWTIDDGALWLDSFDDSGIAMMTGLADSTALGKYPAEDNNGFDRDVVGIPTTDVERMKALLFGELDRRGMTEAQAKSTPPFGGPLVSQLNFTPGPCEAGQGVDANGDLVWQGGAARYLYVLDEGSQSPVVPPDLDEPDGTRWLVEVDHTEAPFEGPVTYGQLPPGVSQRLPQGGAAPAPLVSGETYALYVFRDVAFPLTRCTFTAP